MADPTLSDLMAEIQICKRGIIALARHLGVGRESAASAPAAREVTDADLDAPDGDPEIRKDPSPKKWSGALHKGDRMSQCEPDYLDALAGFLAWKAGADREDAAKAATPEDADKHRKYAGWAERDAAYARAWARRIKARQSDAFGG